MPKNSKSGRVAKGDIVHCTFYDHAENSKDALLFEVFGRVEKVTRHAYLIYCWSYVDDVERAKDSNPENENWFAIVKRAIVDIKVLK
jgi:hypothetical protein